MAKTRNLRDGTLIIRDGTATPNTLTIPIMDGDLSFKVVQPSFILRNRGKIDSRKQADQEALDISFSFKFEQWSYADGNSGISVPDAFQQIGGAVNWNSTDPNCGPFAVDLVFRMTDPCNLAAYEQLVFSNFHADSLDFKEGSEANTVSVTGKALIFKPVRTHVP